MTFDDLNLNGPLRNALEELGYEFPTPIQEKCFSIIMSGRNVIGFAQTGTGKTFAYLLPILMQHSYTEQKAPSVLILVPTRELVLQVVGEIEKLAKYITLRVAGVYGGANINTQRQTVIEGLDVLVATPGRLLDLILDGSLKVKYVKKLVIDEADEMLNLGFRAQILNLLDTLPKKRQNILFSATMSDEVDTLIQEYFDDPHKIEIVPHGTPLEQIEQKAYYVPNYFTKVHLLEHLLQTDEDMSKVLVFAANKKLCDRIYDTLQPKFMDSIGVLHSNKSQNFRINSLKKFHANEYRIMISTDIMARGLDIAEVTHVINFDTPDVPGDYIHRIGRSGRAEKSGIAISFVNEAERDFKAAIEDLMHKKITMLEMPQEVEISNKFTDEERPNLGDKNYLKKASIKHSKGAFHEKKAKNTKVNLGGLKAKALEKHKHKTGKINKRGMK
ncbi:MAG: DEAD/DEAH box helicase [Bacteroidales bacterium]|nr:DEAD/DEAH box helicase [Bacteroidales bacterium]